MSAAELTAGWGGRRSAAPRRVGLLLSGLDLVKVECGGAANAPQPAEFLRDRTQPPAVNDEAVASNCLNVIFFPSPVLTQNLAATSSAPFPSPLSSTAPSSLSGVGGGAKGSGTTGPPSRSIKILSGRLSAPLLSSPN